MATQAEIQTALANEARRGELKQKRSKLMGAIEATASVMVRLSSVNNDALVQMENATAELAALEAGAGPGITADYGARSTIAQMLDTERFAAKEAAIDFVKANPDATEDEAMAVWDAAAMAAHPAFPFVLQSGRAMSELYRANLFARDFITEQDWASHRQFILNTDKAILVSM